MLISTQYFVILVFFFVCSILAVILLLVSYLFSPKKIDSEKIQAYECGFDPFSSKRVFFDMHFYMIAILFIIFDLEVAYLVPWAVNPRASLFETINSSVYYNLDTYVAQNCIDLNLFEYNKLLSCSAEQNSQAATYLINKEQNGLSSSVVFLLFFFIVILGFVYEFFKGSLDWTNNNFIQN